MGRQLPLIILGLISAFSQTIPTVAGVAVVDNHADSPYFTDQPKGGVEVPPAKVEGKRVAIIGAGAAGASSAYYLGRFLSESSIDNMPINITVFEKDRRVGGRATTVNVYDDILKPVEVGAIVFSPENENLVSAAQDLGIETEPWGEESENDQSDMLGIFNGARMVFSLPQDSWRQFVHTFFRYWVLDPIRSKFLAQSTVTKFLAMYKTPIFPFKSLEQATVDAGLHPMVSVTAQQFLTNNGIDGKGRYAREMIQGSTRATYSQNLGKITGFQAMVSLSTADAISIKGGNWKLFQAMIDASNADLRLNTSVTSISKLTTGEWTIRSETNEGKTIEENYDTVILAGPLQFAKLSIEPKLSNEPAVKDYATLHVTLFTSPKQLDPKFFGMCKNRLAPGVILTTPNETEAADWRIMEETGLEGEGSSGFYYITSLREFLRPCGNGIRTEYLYQVLSAQPLEDDKIKAMVGVLDKKKKKKDEKEHEKSEKKHKKHNKKKDNKKKDKKAKNEDHAITWIHRHVWEGAYPQEGPTSVFDDIKLTDGLWYTAGIETFVSTLETSSLMGMNVAKLIVGEWDDAVIGKKQSGLKDSDNGLNIEEVEADREQYLELKH